MPIYEYQCAACGHILEALQKVSEPPLKTCPECHKPKLEKKVSATSFQLKGTGWYATDFKNKGKKESPTKSEDAKTTESKSETKKDSGSSTDKAA